MRQRRVEFAKRLVDLSNEAGTGRDMVATHAEMNLTNDDFLAAGFDLKTAMQTSGWGEDESQELLCAFFGLRADVVTR